MEVRELNYRVAVAAHLRTHLATQVFSSIQQNSEYMKSISRVTDFYHWQT